MKLSGKKTYPAAAGLALVTFARALGWVTPEVAGALYAHLGAAGLAALRAGVGVKSQG